MAEVVVGVKRLRADGARALDGEDAVASMYAMWVKIGDAYISAGDGLIDVTCRTDSGPMEVTIRLHPADFRTVDASADMRLPAKVSIAK